MTRFFCADSSREVLEDKIGSATHHQTYVLIEYSEPWSCSALKSPGIPENLKALMAQLETEGQSIRFLLIRRNLCLLNQQKTVLIYHQEQGDFCGGYQRYEFGVDTLEEVPAIVTDFLNGEPLNPIVSSEDYQDILVCTHGRHDKCCGKYGIPFYKQAIAKLHHLKLENIRVWQASHFGGHRFAPTAITFPDGRYYGGLDVESFCSVVTREGSLEIFNQIYRGWSILPYELQVLEQTLMLQFGWDWFKYKISAKILKQGSDKSWFEVELSIQKPDETRKLCRAEIVRDDEKTVVLKGSCTMEKPVLFVKYYVDQLHIFSDDFTEQVPQEMPEPVTVASKQTGEAFLKTQPHLPLAQTRVSGKTQASLSEPSP
ncbi:MAG: sucrase ferredoxin [Cyanobacteria bacterium J06592_8]